MIIKGPGGQQQVIAGMGGQKMNLANLTPAQQKALMQARSDPNAASARRGTDWLRVRLRAPIGSPR